MKRLLSIVLTLAMLFSMVQLPIVVSAAPENSSTFGNGDDDFGDNGPADMGPGNSSERDDDGDFGGTPGNTPIREDDSDFDEGPSDMSTDSNSQEAEGTFEEWDSNITDDNGPADMESFDSNYSCSHNKTKNRYHDYTYEKYNEEMHKYTKLYDVVCKDCESTLKTDIKISGKEIHYFKNGECEDCGYIIKNCKHKETEDRIVELFEEGNGIYYIEYEVVCSVCDKKLSTYVKHGPVIAIPKDSNCAHEDLKEIVEKEYYEILNEEQHIKVSECKLKCEECGKLFGDYKIEEKEEHSIQNEKCTFCTFEKVSSKNSQINNGTNQINKTGKNQSSNPKANQDTQDVEDIDWIYIKADEQKFAVDGEAVSWEGMPILDPDGNLRVPLRQLAELMGWQVKWDAKTNTAILTDGKVEKRYTKGSDTYEVIDGNVVYTEYLQNSITSENGILYVDLVGALDSTGYSYYINGTSYHIKKTEEVIDKVAINNIFGNYDVVASEDILDTVNGVVNITKDDYLLAMIPKRETVFFAVIVPAAKQALQGNYYDGEVTILGTALEIVVGMLPVMNVVADVRDFLADLQSEDESAIHYMQTVGSLMAVVSDFKDIEKAGDFLNSLKKTGKVLDVDDVDDVNKFIQKADSFEDVADYALKNLDEYNDAAQKADKVADVAATAQKVDKINDATKKADKVADAARTVTKKVSKPSSRKLAKNLEAAGIEKPTKYKVATHHIVAGTEPDAAESRKILEKFNIDINDAANGVYLPNEKNAPTKALYHPPLNTKVYNENVYKMLKDATSREKAIETLKKIRDMLLNGTFKYKE